MSRIGRIGLSVGLALAMVLAGCDANQAPVVPTTKGEPEAKAAPAPTPPARGKATPKTLPRSEGKR